MSTLQPTPAGTAPVDATSRRCASCASELSGPYCGRCGQRVLEGRLTVRGILKHLVTDALDLNRGLLFTFRELWLRPGPAIREYLAGRTVRYTNPVKYFLVVAAVMTFVYVQSGQAARTAAELADGLRESTRGGVHPDAAALLSFLSSYFSLIVAAGIPTSALATRLVFRRAGYNYAEHLIFNIYVGAQQCVVLTAGVMMMGLVGPRWSEGVFSTGMMLLGTAYLCHASLGFVPGRPAPTVARAVAAAALATAFFVLLAFAAGTVVGAAVAVLATP